VNPSKPVILRSPAFWDDEGSPQFAENIHRLAMQSNCRDSSAPKERGPLQKLDALLVSIEQLRPTLSEPSSPRN